MAALCPHDEGAAVERQVARAALAARQPRQERAPGEVAPQASGAAILVAAHGALEALAVSGLLRLTAAALAIAREARCNKLWEGIRGPLTEEVVERDGSEVAVD